MPQRRAENPSTLRRPEHVDAIHRRPVRLVPLDTTRDDNETLPSRRDALMHASEQGLWKQGDLAGRGIDELALLVHHIGCRPVESADDEDLSIGERDSARVRARLRELADRLRPGRRHRCGPRSAGRYQDDDRECEELPHWTWRVALPTGTPCPENQATPSCTTSNPTRYMPGPAGIFTMTLSVTASPGATAAGIAVRTPSHTKSRPSATQRWYAALNAPGCQVVVPVFVMVTGTVIMELTAPFTLAGAE